MTQRFEMLERADSAAATARRLDPHTNERPPENSPTWGARQGGPRPAGPLPPLPVPPPTPNDDVGQMRRWAGLLRSTYTTRPRFFPGHLFSDPVWNMLLDLIHARLHGRQISVSSLCIASDAPATTALRRIGDLVSAGLVARVKDPRDGRRVFVELTAEGYDAMTNYLSHIGDTVCQTTEGESHRE